MIGIAAGGGAVFTVRATVVVCIKLREVPVTVTVLVPVVAVPLAVSVSVLATVEGFGLNVAFTPLGKPEADMLTLPVKPFDGVTEIVLVLLFPSVTVTLAGDANKLKSGVGPEVGQLFTRFVGVHRSRSRSRNPSRS